MVCLKAPDKSDDLAKKALGWFGVGWLRQFEFERELLGFAAAFGRGVVLSVEQVERTGIEAVVVGLVLGRAGVAGVRGRGGGSRKRAHGLLIFAARRPGIFV